VPSSTDLHLSDLSANLSATIPVIHAQIAMAMENPFLILMYFVHVSVFEGMIYMATLAD